MTRLLKKVPNVPSLTREYNRRGRHPLHGIQSSPPVNHHAGNIRFGVPLAAVAVIAGAMSYALVERPAPYRPIHPQNEVSAIALGAMEPAAGLKVPDAPADNGPRGIMDISPPSNAGLLTVSDLDESQPVDDADLREDDVIDMERVDIEDIYDDSDRFAPSRDRAAAARAAVSVVQVEPSADSDAPATPPTEIEGIYTETKAAPVASVKAEASRYVTVERNATASDYQALVASAERALETGRYDSAMEMYESLRQRNPRDIRALMGLAVSQQRYGLDEAAIHTYETVLEIDPENTEATINMMGLMQDVRPEEAYRKLSVMWSKNPQSPGIAAQLGLVAAQLGRQDEAMRYVGIAASLEPENASHLYNLAVITDRRGGKARAIELYEKALEIDATYGSSRSVPRELIYDRLYFLRRL